MALAWKAGLSAETAVDVQCRLLGIERDAAIRAEAGNYAMSEDDMEWQLELIGEG